MERLERLGVHRANDCINSSKELIANFFEQVDQIKVKDDKLQRVSGCVYSKETKTIEKKN